MSAGHALALFVLFCLIVSTTTVPAESAETKLYPKLESILYQLALSNDTENFSKSHNLAMVNGKVRVVIELSDESKSIPQQYNITQETSYRNLIQAQVPIDELIALSQEQDVRFIRTPMTPIKATSTARPNISMEIQETPPKPTGSNLAILTLICCLFLIKRYVGR